MSLRVGVGLPHGVTTAGTMPLAEAAQLAEHCGLDSVWVSDHTTLFDDPASRYPFSRDGRFSFPSDSHWFDWVASLGHLSAATSSIRLGVAVAIVAHRHPVVLGKQVATLDQLSGGRIELGVGAGWLREEFDAVGVPFEGRGARLDACLDVMRQVWTGRPAGGSYGPFELPDGVHTFPTPVQSTVPILVGGHSPAALRRIARHGDGWLGVVTARSGAADTVRNAVESVRQFAADHGRDPDELRIVLRLAAPSSAVGTADFRSFVVDLVRAGATELNFDISWQDERSAERVLRVLRSIRDSTDAGRASHNHHDAEGALA